MYYSLFLPPSLPLPPPLPPSLSDHAEDGMDLFEETIRDLFNSADSEGKGTITKEDFLEVSTCKQ